MPGLQLTAHAAERVRQRGLRERDLELVLEYGTLADDAVVLTGKDAAREIEVCRRRIRALERLRGTAVFIAETAVITVYRPDRERRRRLFGYGPKLHRVHRRRSRAR